MGNAGIHWDRRMGKVQKGVVRIVPQLFRRRKYSIANLQSLIEKQASSRIEDAEDFGVYRRSFLTVATYQ